MSDPTRAAVAVRLDHDGGSPPLRPELFRRAPGFSQALRHYAEAHRQFFSHQRLLNKTVLEVWRFHVLVFALHLADTRDPSDPRSGLTLSRLQGLCRAQGMASPGRVAALLGIMRLARFLRPVATADRRTRALEPSPAFVDIVQGWTGFHLAALDAMEPERNLAGRLRADPGFGWRVRYHQSLRVLRGWRATDAHPDIAHFVQRDAGFMILVSLVLAVLEGTGDPDDPVAVDAADWASRYAVSRSHVASLVADARRAGLLIQADGRSRMVRIAPRLWDDFNAFVAEVLDSVEQAVLTVLTEDAGSLRAAE